MIDSRKYVLTPSISLKGETSSLHPSEFGLLSVFSFCKYTHTNSCLAKTRLKSMKSELEKYIVLTYQHLIDHSMRYRAIHFYHIEDTLQVTQIRC